jgi:lantibiotic modifying enzyme
MKHSLRDKVERRLFAIEKYYLSEYKNDLQTDGMGLLSGLSGVILLQSLFFQHTKNDKFKIEIDNNLDFLIETIEKEEYTTTTFCDGLAGIGWLFHYLHAKQIIDVNIDEFLGEMDEVLESELAQMLNQNNFDLLHGAIGLGLYFLKRGHHQPVEKIISALNRNCDFIGNQIAWRRFDHVERHTYTYNFGLPHGNIGILYFLGKCYQCKILPGVAFKLIHGGVNFYLANIQDQKKYGSFFPYDKLVDDYEFNKVGSYTRLGWCYGDPGVLHTLLLISDWIDDCNLKEKFMKLSILSTNRKSKTQSGIVDACFCHGLSGIVYQYRNMYKMTKNEAFAESSDYWIHKLVSSSTKLDDEPNYLYYNGARGWENPPPNLLIGLGGVSLALMSFIYTDMDNSWNEVFFLS